MNVENVLYIGIPIIFVIIILIYFFNVFLNRRLIFEKKNEQQNIIVPLKLQAAERMALFLERIRPKSLVMRANLDLFTAQDLQIFMTSEIRNELNHNVAQQVYISTDTWDTIILAVNKTQNDLNQAFGSNSKISSAREMAKILLQNADDSVIDLALKNIKNEEVFKF